LARSLARRLARRLYTSGVPPLLPISALARLVPARPLTRFAPAPTGYLHLGHLVNAVFVWGLARARGGRVILRVEDHDRQRCRPEYEAALLEDLEWLGLYPDLGTPDELRRGPSPFRQSDNSLAYEAMLGTLRARGLVYACDCSRRDLAVVAGDPLNRETPYSGRCRERGLAEAPGRGLRLRVDPGTEAFVDLLLGPCLQDPAGQCGDLLLRDRMGNWTYQFAVVVDDVREGVDLIIRGEDLLDSTGRQLLLRRLLGGEGVPVFIHHPLIRKGTGEKLSKANRDTSIRELRAAGVAPADLLGRAAALAGLRAEPAPLAAAELASLFTY
jgi:glutamyl-tRNA synthetase/glutamyl-Q tRNA(Asp) synthetase